MSSSLVQDLCVQRASKTQTTILWTSSSTRISWVNCKASLTSSWGRRIGITMEIMTGDADCETVVMMTVVRITVAMMKWL